MDAEKLRTTYNKYFTQGQNSWSSTDFHKTLKVARRTLSWLKKLGYKKTGSKVLDVGCATGFYTESFRQLGCKTVGLDYSEVAVEQAKNRFPQCEFIQMNGFEPLFNEKFDIIFCRGFSGVNTHDLQFISGWINKYMKYLSTNGFFILAYSSNFSGTEMEGETINHSKQELDTLVKLIDGKYRATYMFHYFGFLSKVKKRVLQFLSRKKDKAYYYIFIQKS